LKSHPEADDEPLAMLDAQCAHSASPSTSETGAPMSVRTEGQPASPPLPPEPPPRGDRLVAIAVVLAATALLAVVALIIALAAGAFVTERTTPVTRTAGVPGAGPGLNAAAIYAAANPGVVDITAHSTTTTAAGPFGVPRQAEQTDTGTGLVVDAKGDILTAGHVVAGADSVTVTLPGGVTRKATVLGGDTATDVAALKIDPSGLRLHPLPLGTLAGHRVGDQVAVIGDPFDVQRSLSTGVISGLDRTIQAPNGYSIPHAIQTDAAMNPGNSGGPILDASGRVIGIADQIATGGGSSDTSTGVGFAVPIDSLKGELAQLETGKVPAHADIGVGAADATTGGALVQSVRAGGPAARAGVHVGDIIVGLGRVKIASVNDLVAATMTTQPGAQTTLVVIRGGKTLTLRVALGREPTQATSGG
jgi:S1-C subfamily serine protease